jgi:hypothetical protein
MAKVPGWIVLRPDGRPLKDSYGTVILFTEYTDAKREADRLDGGLSEPLVRYDRRQRGAR